MKTLILSILTICYTCTSAFAGEGEKELTKEEKKFVDSVRKIMKYETGLVGLTGGIAELNIPAGFKFLNKEQAEYVVTSLWGNPPQQGVLGLLVPQEWDPIFDSTYAFVISFENMGYVKDSDADKIDYADLLKDIRKEEPESNKQRTSMGYETIHMVGWASNPFYDKTKKVLHWAKELRFGNQEVNTLNYDVRVLGRRGILSLNAVTDIGHLNLVKRDIDKVLSMARFTSGNRYEDFDSKTDNVAAWTVGGLVAGKILAKVGGFKFLKLIFIGIAAAIGAAWRFITGRRKKKEEETMEQAG
jgi:uncharacterized membrane-anchored protein